MSFALLLLLAAAEGAAFGSGGRFWIEQSRDSFGTRSHGIIERLGPTRTRFYPLPQSTAADYNRLRSQDPRTNSMKPGEYETQEVVGPHQVENGRLWFGKQYYDSEGATGVGAFAYFDTLRRTYRLFSPPEVARYEISAILVQRDCVWLGLDRFHEDISKSPGGLARWDRMAQSARRYPLEFVVSRIRAEGDSLRLDTPGGYALFRGGEVRRFRSGGEPIARFPPPPTKY